MKMSLGAFIAQLRKEKALTQKQLSEILGVSDKTVSHWEREESAPDISILPLLADTLGVSVDELLAGEKKPTPPAQEIRSNIPQSQAHTKSEDDFHKFKTKNIVAVSVSALALLFGVCLFVFISLFVVAFDLFVFGVSAIYTWAIYYNYVYKHKDDSDIKQKALRVSSISFYCNLSFILIMITSLFVEVIGALVLLSFIIAPLICVLIEVFLRKKGVFPKDPKWPKERRDKLKLKIACTLMAFVLLFLTLFANEEFPYDYIIYDMAEYTEFTTLEEFDEYIEKDVPYPAERYTGEHIYEVFVYSDDGVTKEAKTSYSNNEDGFRHEIYFDYNNKEVAAIIPTDGNGLPIKCYTHSALLAIDEARHTKINIISICLFALYPLSIAISISVYFAIKKKKGL